MASIDVVIPCYNYAHFLRQCVRSVLSEAVADLRVIIIDNASTDNSVEVAHQLAEKDPRVEIICHTKNLGPQASFNEGIDLARADYFMILCADDLLTAGSIRYGIDLMEKYSNTSFVLGSHMESWVGERLPELVQQLDGVEMVSGTTFIERCCQSLTNVPAHAILVRTSVQKQVGHYRASLPFMDDVEMVLRLAPTGLVAKLPAPIAVPRLHGANLTGPLWNDRLRVLQERESVFKSFFSHEGADLPNAIQLLEVQMRRLAEAAFWSAASHLVRGKQQQAFELLRFGYRLSPASILVPPLGHLLRTKGSFKRIAAVVSGWGR
ncbi:glycosyltransferase family 2 protein [Sinorhizobium fredii]|uniref:glycosyltransferase family 2 protein n=1 Tax=Rhizobium fredii TaxID=380 RepID=UPI0012978757|nr:glycosyltransferase family 2 protein [Sinorhizobium fredii]MQW96236.1 glycosyltransferase [Sinorhizobium fredii]UTY46266.1 glycosyltransferase family 2 protein [Sinorhizobium fredii]